MVVNDLITILRAKCIAYPEGLDREVQYVFCSDSFKILEEKASQDFVWVQTDVDKLSIDLAHKKQLSGIIIPYNLHLSDELVEYAEDIGISIISTGYSNYKICTKIFEAFKERT